MRRACSQPFTVEHRPSEYLRACHPAETKEPKPPAEKAYAMLSKIGNRPLTVGPKADCRGAEGMQDGGQEKDPFWPVIYGRSGTAPVHESLVWNQAAPSAVDRRGQRPGGKARSQLSQRPGGRGHRLSPVDL